MSIVEHNWAAARCPILNGIFFPDDTIAVLDVVAPMRADAPYGIAARSRVAVEAALPGTSMLWTGLGELARATDSQQDVTAVVGEGGMGGDGFVAAMNASRGSLLWLAFFDCSNPFRAVTLTQGVIAARTSLDVEWVFPVRRPEQVSTRVIERATP